jgi:F-type H+-transporting ATPase subunit a
MTILLFFGVANLGALIPGVGSVGNCMVKEKEETSLAEGGPATVEGQAEAPAAPAEANTQATGEQSAFRGLPGYCGDGNFIIPWLRAPAADLNVTLAFALVAMFMVQFFGFQALGLGYLTKFFNFKEGFLGAFLGLIELISEIGRIISFAFRMFGNIFGGEVILVVMAYLFPYILPLPFYGFEVFVALMQALIFAVLTLIFFSLAVTAHGGHDEHGDDHGHGVQQIESDVSRAVTTDASHARV